MSGQNKSETKGLWHIRDPQSTDQLDTGFSVLQAARRRYLLYYLCGKEGAVLPLEEVVEGVQKYENTGKGENESPSRQTVRTSLVHNHLPRLADVGVLEHDPRHGTVQFHGYKFLEEWLEWARRLEIG